MGAALVAVGNHVGMRMIDERDGMTANLIGVMDMAGDKFALEGAIRLALNRVGIIRFWWIRIHKGVARIVFTR